MMLRKLYHSVKWCAKHLKWVLQTPIIRDFACQRNSVKFQADGSILVIAPHADDELIGCYQLIKNYSSNVTVFYCSFLGSNYSDNNRVIRENEIKNYINSQGIGLYISSPKQIAKDLLCVINTIKPNYVFIPSIIDWHPEHRKVNIIIADIVKNFPFYIGWYHVSLPIPGDFVSAYSSMTETEQKNKWSSMQSFYTSQLHMDIERFVLVEKLSGETDYAREVYMILSDDRFLSIVQNAIDIEEHLDNLKTILGDLNKMYKQTNAFYRKICTS